MLHELHSRHDTQLGDGTAGVTGLSLVAFQQHVLASSQEGLVGLKGLGLTPLVGLKVVLCIVIVGT